MSALALRSVSVTLGNARVVDRVTVEVGEGEWVALIGPNGAGKTTVLRALAGLVAYDGEIEILGDDTRSLPRKELARRVAVVPQVPLMPPDATVLEYVLLGRTPYIGYFGTERRSDHEAAEGALEELDLQSLAGRRIDSLSGGERQRASLARALAQDAPILLLDEPTTALDVGRQQQVLEIVDRLRVDAGLTVFSTMHDLTLAGQYTDRLLLLDRGRIVAGGAAGDVLTAPLIAEHYGADVEVLADADSGFVVVPVRRRP
jgi:iron complex transport system ATP-binding protein